MSFFQVFIAQLALGLVPGFTLLSLTGVTFSLSICLAFPVSLSLYSILGIVFGELQIYGTAPMLAGTMAVLMLAAAIKTIIFRIHVKDSTVESNQNNNNIAQSNENAGKPLRLPAAPLVLSIAFALFIFFNTYYLTIGSMDHFVQYDDNATHLAMIESEARLGNYSAIRSAYNLPDDPHGIGESGYYPNGFHIIPALSCALSGTNAAISENAAAVLYACILLPMGMTALSYLASGKNELAALAMVPMPLASVAFPLRMLTVHAPFPNIAGFSLLPLFCTAFMLAFDLNEPQRRRYFFPLAMTLLALGFTHPNALIFGCIYIFPFFLLNYIPQACSVLQTKITFKNSVVVRTALQLASIAFACALWIFLYEAPFMESIISFIWEWSIPLPTALQSVVNGALLLGWPQLAFGLLALIGSIECFVNERRRWMSATCALIAAIYIGTAAGGDSIKSLLSGFWYTDPERLAAMMAIAMIPLAASGLHLIAQAIGTAANGIITRIARKKVIIPSKSITIASLIILTCVFTLKNYRPLVGNIDMQVDTAWAQNYFDLRNSTLQTPPNPYLESERSFIQRVHDIVGDDLILNNPYDGSTFAYSVDGLNLYYPYRPNGRDSKTSKLIRTRLHDYMNDAKTEEAIRAIGAKWMLELDKSEYQLSLNGKNMLSPNLSYEIKSWKGFEGIDKNTPGFTLVLEDGPYKLYRLSGFSG